MPDKKIYLGSNPTGTLLASCDGIQILIDTRFSDESFKDVSDHFSDRSLALRASITLVPSGRVEDIVSIHTLRATVIAATPQPYFLLYANGGSLSGIFQIEHWAEGGPEGQEQRFTLRLVSHGPVAYTAP